MTPTQWPITQQWATYVRSQWKQIQIPTVELMSSMGPIVPAMTLEGRQNAVEKSRPVNIQHLIHWGWIDIECVFKMRQ